VSYIAGFALGKKEKEGSTYGGRRGRDLGGSKEREIQGGPRWRVTRLWH